MSNVMGFTRTSGSVLSVSEARTSLPKVLEEFRQRGLVAEPVHVGTHRKDEAVLIPAALWNEVLPAAEEALLKAIVRDRIESDAQSVPLDAELVASWGLEPADFDL